MSIISHQLEDNAKLVYLLQNLNANIIENTHAIRQFKSVLMKVFKYESREDNLEKTFFRSDQVPVQVKAIFLKIGEIDTLKEQYQAEIFIEAKWMEPTLKEDDIHNFNPSNYWNPKILVENAVGDMREECNYKVIMDENSKFATIYEMRKIKGVFLENLELFDFPVDVQDLSVSITTSRTINEIIFVGNTEDLSSINTDAFIDQQEWKLHKHVECCNKITKRDTTNVVSEHPAIVFTCHASRRPGYFYWNVYFLIFFITTMAFCTFSVKPDLPQNRLQLAFTLLLTAVTFKWVVNRSLPPISYLTSLDKYVLASMFLLCMICVWHACVSIIDNRNTFLKSSQNSTDVFSNFFRTSLGDKLTFAEGYDRIVLIFLAGLYVLLHIIFILWMYFVAYKRRREMFSKDKKYMEAITKNKEEKSKVVMNSRQNSLKSQNGIQENVGNDLEVILKVQKSKSVVYYTDNTNNQTAQNLFNHLNKQNSEKDLSVEISDLSRMNVIY